MSEKKRGERKLDESFEKQCTVKTTTTAAAAANVAVSPNLELFNQLASKLNEVKTRGSPTHVQQVAKYAQSWLVDSTKSITDIWTRAKSSQPLPFDEKMLRNKEHFLATCLAPELRRRRAQDNGNGGEAMDTDGHSAVVEPAMAMAMATVIPNAIQRNQSGGSIDPSSSSSSSSSTSSATGMSSSTADALGNSKTAFTTANDGGVATKPTPVVLAAPTNGVEAPAVNINGDAATVNTRTCANNGGLNGDDDGSGDANEGSDNHHGNNNGETGVGDGMEAEEDGDDDDNDNEDDVYRNENRGLYCVCEQSHQFRLDGQTRMCDACNAWYHVACVLPYTPASQAKAWTSAAASRSRMEAGDDDDEQNLFICPICLKSAEFGKRYEPLINYRYEKQLRLKLLTVHSVQPNDIEFGWETAASSSESDSMDSEPRGRAKRKKKKVTLEDFLPNDDDDDDGSRQEDSSGSSESEEERETPVKSKPSSASSTSAGTAPRPLKLKLAELTETEKKKKLDEFKAKHSAQPKSIKTLDGYRDPNARPATTTTPNKSLSGGAKTPLTSLKDRIKQITPVKEQQKLAANASSSSNKPVSELSTRNCVSCSKLLPKYVVDTKHDGTKVTRINDSQYCNNACVASYIETFDLPNPPRINLMDKKTNSRTSITKRPDETLEAFKKRCRDIIGANKRYVSASSVTAPSSAPIAKPQSAPLTTQRSHDAAGSSKPQPGGKTNRPVSATSAQPQPFNVQEGRANLRSRLFASFREKLTAMEQQQQQQASSSSSDASSGDKLQIDDAELTKLIEAIENELYAALSLNLSAYRQKILSIISNIKDPSNRTFIRKLIRGEIKPDQLATLDSSGMKSDEVIEKEKRERMQETIRQIDYERERQEVAMRMIRLKKTRQGDVEVQQYSYTPELEGYNASNAGVSLNNKRRSQQAPETTGDEEYGQSMDEDGGYNASSSAAGGFNSFEIITMDQDGPLGAVISMPATDHFLLDHHASSGSLPLPPPPQLSSFEKNMLTNDALPLPTPIMASATVKAVVPSLDHVSPPKSILKSTAVDLPALQPLASILRQTSEIHQTTSKTTSPVPDLQRSASSHVPRPAAAATHDPDFDSDPEDNGHSATKPPTDPRLRPKAATTAVDSTKPPLVASALSKTLPMAVPPPIPILSLPPPPLSVPPLRPILTMPPPAIERPGSSGQSTPSSSTIQFHPTDFQFDLSLKSPIPPDSPTKKVETDKPSLVGAPSFRSLGDLTRQTSEASSGAEDGSKPFWSGLIRLKESTCGVRGFLLNKADQPECPLTEKLRKHRFPPCLTHTQVTKLPGHDVWNHVFQLSKRKEMAFFRLESAGKDEGSTDLNEDQSYVTMHDDVMFPLIHAKIGAFLLPKFHLPAVYTDKEKPHPAECLYLVALKQKASYEEEDINLKKNLSISIKRDKNHIIGILIGMDKPTVAGKNDAPATLTTPTQDASSQPFASSSSSNGHQAQTKPPGNGETNGSENGKGGATDKQEPAKTVTTATAVFTRADPRLERLNSVKEQAAPSVEKAAAKEAAPAESTTPEASGEPKKKRVTRFSDGPSLSPTSGSPVNPATTNPDNSTESYQLAQVLFKYFAKGSTTELQEREKALALFNASLEKQPLTAEERDKLNRDFVGQVDDFLILVNNVRPVSGKLSDDEEVKMQEVLQSNAARYLKEVQESMKEEKTPPPPQRKVVINRPEPVAAMAVDEEDWDDLPVPAKPANTTGAVAAAVHQPTAAPASVSEPLALENEPNSKQQAPVNTSLNPVSTDRLLSADSPSDDSFQSANSSPPISDPAAAKPNSNIPGTSSSEIPSDRRSSFLKLLEINKNPELRATLSLNNQNWAYDPTQQLVAKVSQHRYFCSQQQQQRDNSENMNSCDERELATDQHSTEHRRPSQQPPRRNTVDQVVVTDHRRSSKLATADSPPKPKFQPISASSADCTVQETANPAADRPASAATTESHRPSISFTLGQPSRSSNIRPFASKKN